ncbi:hypothetical protein AADZ90_014650 [Aestuariibius sp. 2305UL40-4]|uniref:hypothetical protein n=1 Tax=Aestuariibius violaceus TaxID=3234132 RepID=UPI00345E3959
MTPGGYISGAAHAVFLSWLFLGWGLDQEPLPFEFSEVDVVSAEEFAALTNRTAPDVPSEEPPAPVVPEPEEVVPPAAPEPEDVAVVEPEEVTPPPVEEQPPEPEAPPEPPAPEPEPNPEPVAEPQPPAPDPLDEPEQEPLQPTRPQAPQNLAAGDATRPVPRPSERVSDEANVPQEPDVATADEVQQAVVEDAEEPDVQDEAQEDAAPEESSPVTVTEADEPADGEVIQEEPVASLAPGRSLRPQIRPNRPEPRVAEASSENVEPETGNVEDVLAGLVEETPETPAAPSGPPLTSGEVEGLRLAIGDCWVLPIATDAQQTTVVVSFGLTREGGVEGVTMVSADGPNQTANTAAFEAARRAILRCERGGYDLPAEKYEHWQRVQVTFDPNQMRLR